MRNNQKALELINKELSDYDYYSCHPPMSWNKYIITLKQLKALLSEEGKEVDLLTGSPTDSFYKCPNCRELFDSDSKYCNHCGQKLIWPEQEQKGEG